MMVYRKPPKFYGREQIKRATESPAIIHFTTSFLSRRPWVEGCRHKYVGEWMKYKKATGLRGVYITLIKHMPRKIMIGVSGVLQAYGRPFIVKIRSKNE